MAAESGNIVQIAAYGLSKTDAAAGVIQSGALEIEDDFRDLYSAMQGDKTILEPTFNLKLLRRLTRENNAIQPCVDAMETNVAGTGYEIEPAGGRKEDGEDDRAARDLREFLDEVWPGVSFTTMRKRVRRDIEEIGNGYMEILRNPAGEIVFLRHVDAAMMRLVKLDAAVPAEKMVRRRGQDVKVKVAVRERRFVQRLGAAGSPVVWFKEFGATRDLDKDTGDWAPSGKRLPASQRATEVIHFRAIPDALTPYGAPRWISQTPSVLGSRRAEEYNLEFFNSGGVPPALIVVQGGMLAEEARKALEALFSGAASKKNRVKVVEAHSTSGDLGSANTVRVTVERFGAERQNDSMFESYDEKSEQRVRRSWRLPPIFVGKADDHNFATAYASYMVAEAQVFKPERDAEDEVYNTLLVPALTGGRDYVIRSRQLQITDVTNQLKALELANATNRVDGEAMIASLNEIAGTNLKVSAEPVNPISPQARPGQAVTDQPAEPQAASARALAPTQKSASAGVLALAQDTMLALRRRDVAELQKNIALASGLAKDEQGQFRSALATFQFLDPSMDPEGLGEIMGCTVALLHANCRDHAH